MSKFVDKVTIKVQSGRGGNGCVSIHREKFKPLGGPDGGNGGAGGSVILRADMHTHTLLDFHFRPNIFAKNGKPGQGNNRNGAAGDDVILLVPLGTMVFDSSGSQLADLVYSGQECVVAAGGTGGLGNAALVSKRRKAPGFALLGGKGESKDLILELKMMAEVGLVGFPSAGKSSLIAALSKVKPKIAAYPFTTLTPNLGVVEAGAVRFTVADVPGLIPGAANGKGLGLDFLRHLERCAVLVFVVDLATLDPERDPISEIRILENELKQYSFNSSNLDYISLLDKPKLIALNKIDIPDAAELANIILSDLEQFNYPIYQISALTHKGLAKLKFDLAKIVVDYRKNHSQKYSDKPIVKIKTLTNDNSFTIVADIDNPGGYRVSGFLPEKWVEQTQFDNYEAVGYLADKLARLGIEEKLIALGAKPGAEITIGEITFNWEPEIVAGETPQMIGRGEDIRLNQLNPRDKKTKFNSND